MTDQTTLLGHRLDWTCKSGQEQLHPSAGHVAHIQFCIFKMLCPGHGGLRFQVGHLEEGTAGFSRAMLRSIRDKIGHPVQIN